MVLVGLKNPFKCHFPILTQFLLLSQKKLYSINHSHFPQFIQQKERKHGYLAKQQNWKACRNFASLKLMDVCKPRERRDIAKGADDQQ
ncbi:hypothetical protein SLEP1_g38618 [Rubroshorea leprosula]|uniref:Uncharacterized protein n=1 Tax=Rubroshorea leprosula TaxID=152421 RepID=A0AAV5KY70_9ROSI|nr:hypothetical protein SLEP1_g38618 [Rubroshorea leprosula]